MANQNFKVKKGLEVGTGVTISDGGVNITGVITAAQFSGDGSGLTGVTAAGSGVVVQEEGSSVGTAATINFIGSNVTAAISGGVASVTVTSGSSDVVSDTTPQLGGNLDLNNKNITGTGSIAITGGFNATGVSTFQESVTFQSHALFGDNDKAVFGAGQDLQIYHDGSHSRIVDSGTGSLISQASRFSVHSADDSETMIDAVENSQVKLYFNGNEKFSTTNTGITVTGAVSATTFSGAGSGLTDVDADNASNLLVSNQTGNAARVITFAGTSAGGVNAAVFGNANFTYNPSTTELKVGSGVTINSTGVTVTGITSSTQLIVSGVSTSLGNLIIGDQNNTASELKVFSGGTGANPEYFKFGAVNRVGTIQLNDNSTLGEMQIKARQGIALYGNTSHISVWAKGDGSGSLLYQTAEKLVTTNTGVTVTGTLAATAVTGDGSGLTSLTGASAGTFGASNATPIITVDSNGRITGISTVATAGAGGGGGISNIVEDTTPQLGGNLDLNSKDITGSGDLDYTGNLKVTGISTITGVAGFSSHVTLPDHAQIQVGNATGGDLKIYHDGSNSYVSDAGTGGLKITGSDVYIRNVSDQDMIHASSGSFVKLYHNNALRLQTTGTGVNITDDLNVAGVSTFVGNINLLSDSAKFIAGAGSDLEIYHNGNNYVDATEGNLYIRTTGGASVNRNMYIRSNNDIYIQSGGSSPGIKLTSGGASEIHHGGGAGKKLETTTTGATVTGTLTATAFSGDGSALTNLPASGITTAVSNTQVTYNIGASGNNYVITGPGYSNSDNNPDIYLVRGQRYRFINATGTSHPFRIQSDTSGTAYTDGVSGSQSGTQEFNVQHDAPSRLFYQCTVHSGMIGNIYITGGGQWENTSVAASGTPEIYTDYAVGIGTDNPGAKTHIDSVTSNTPLVVEASQNNRSRIVFRNNVETGTECNIELIDDDLRFVTNSGERLRITSDGNIGVGYDSPSQKLVVKGTTSLMATNSTNQWMAYTYTDNTFRLNYNGAGADELTITSDGTLNLSNGTINLGTADSSSGHINAYEVMTFNIDSDDDDSNRHFTWYKNAESGGGTGMMRLDENGRLVIGGDLATSGNNLTLKHATGVEIDMHATSGSGNNFRIKSDSNGTFTIRDHSAGADRLTITDSGNIGINSTTPTSYANSQATLVIEDTISPALCISDTGQARDWFLIGQGDGLAINYADGGGSSSASNATGSMFFRNNGNVGINDTAPSQKLNVGGNIMLEGSDQYLYLTNVGTGNAGIYVRGNTSGSYLRSHSTGIFTWEVTGSEKMRLNSDGKLILSMTGRTTPHGAQGDGAMFIEQSYNGNLYALMLRNKDTGASASTSLGFSLNRSGGDQDFEAGKIAIVKEQAWTTTSSTVDGSMVFSTIGNGSLGERLRITSDGKIGINVTSPGCQTGGIHAVHDATQGTPSFTGAEVGIFQRNYNSAQDCAISIVSGTNASSIINFGDKDDVDPGIIEYMNGSDAMRFSTNAGEAMRITSGRSLLVGTTATNPGDGNTTTGAAFSSNGKYFLSCNTDGGHMNRNNAGYVLHTRYQGNHRGGIYVYPSATQYNTSSDYRLKENVVDISGAITRIKELAPRRFNFISEPGKTVDGFIAHEAATVVPESVTGTKDEVDSNGDPVYQGIDNGKFVPLLTAALQEAIAKIETLEARITALEG